MALSSLPLGFTKMLLPLQSKSYPTPQCKPLSNKLSNNCQRNLRRSANFKPSIWTYDYIQSLSSEYKEEKYIEQGRMLREEVRTMLGRLENPLDQLELIDVLQRLGIDYHFGNEIKNILDNVYHSDAFRREKNLYATALEFRLLRQHGYDISTDVFVCFQDEVGNFKKNLSVDVEGMLSLYEASFHLMEEESILDGARDFTSQFLKEYLNQNRGDHISLLISHALEFPLHWRIHRWEAPWFINAYEGKPNMSSVLLLLAKLDFNFLQAIYHNELKYTSR
ncbi:myrcene synthase, chloroplastic-like [Abrus precatorius]|uniref:Myrcene synthase, chloroplastic-like n=1 Tax=Abrus precatorius TaxID=3816 RepID=A0A8B8KJG0_ABRPR|nr:myrcene synthase, chloroplastic-like [Abrus precatorius]